MGLEPGPRPTVKAGEHARCRDLPGPLAVQVRRAPAEIGGSSVLCAGVHPRIGEPALQRAEILTQRAAGDASDQRPGKPISQASRVQDFIDVGLSPTFAMAIKRRDPACILIARSIDEPCWACSAIYDAYRVCNECLTLGWIRDRWRMQGGMAT